MRTGTVREMMRRERERLRDAPEGEGTLLPLAAAVPGAVRPATPATAPARPITLELLEQASAAPLRRAA